MSFFNIFIKLGLSFVFILSTVDASVQNSNHVEKVLSSGQNSRQIKHVKHTKKFTPHHKSTQSVKDPKVYDEVKKIYENFLQVLKTGPTAGHLLHFFGGNFDQSSVFRTLIGSQATDDGVRTSLLEYCLSLMKGDLIKKVADYKLSEDYTMIKKRNLIIVKCKLLGKDSDDVIDMSVNLTKDLKVKDLVFMQTIHLIKGARSVIDIYCQSHNKVYRKMKRAERIEIAKAALDEYVKNNSAAQPSKK